MDEPQLKGEEKTLHSKVRSLVLVPAFTRLSTDCRVSEVD